MGKPARGEILAWLDPDDGSVVSAYNMTCNHIPNSFEYTEGLVLASDLTAAEARIVELEEWRQQVCLLIGMGTHEDHIDKTPTDVHKFVLAVDRDRCQRIEAAEAVSDRRLGLLTQARLYLPPSAYTSGHYGEVRDAIDAELTGTPVADGGE